MRFTVFPALLAGASLASYAAASPIRVVVVTSAADVSTNVSFGDARPIPVVASEPSMHAAAAAATQAMQPGAGHHHFCSKLKDKALAWSNKFRETLGLPLIAPEPPMPPVMPEPPAFAKPLPLLPPPPIRIPHEDNHGVHIMPIGGPLTRPVFVNPDDFERSAIQGHHHGHHVHHHVMGPHHHGGSFLHHVHRALMTLGPWEGRAVAFVLGCGIGVLLRMLWVMTIVIARAVRSGRRSADGDEVHDILVFEVDAEEILVPPPQYTDEKVALAAPSTAERENKA